MAYNPQKIEKKWKSFWQDNAIFEPEESTEKPKYYVLDMFPYPSGAGLHVGHPLGYIASDIIARYKKLNGYNVMHPMGFDAFGLPAEQYAIQTGQHPAATTKKNIKKYTQQLKNIGLAYNWKRQVVTSDPNYYRWTQWIFLQLFHHYFNTEKNKAIPIEELEKLFAEKGSRAPVFGTKNSQHFTAKEWQSFNTKQKQTILMRYRLAYLDFANVNWCEALGTVLANDEVKDGRSERGNHPVERRKMKQWFLRITAYADRLLDDMQSLQWSAAMKDMQSHWIGKSRGVELNLPVANQPEETIQVFTTRPDTIFGVSFIVIAPESELVEKLTTKENKDAVKNYIQIVKNKSERERQAESKQMSGIFTGNYAIHPFTKEKLPIWVADYVLAGYGTGAIMAVPAHDDRDFQFAKQYKLPIPVVVMDKTNVNTVLPYTEKKGTLINSDWLNNLKVTDAIEKSISVFEKEKLGKSAINYRLRDANFSRQRYWGEPFPIFYKDDIAWPMQAGNLPLKLPNMDNFKPTGSPKGPLSRAKEWLHPEKNITRETSTMPGYAGSSWYFLRYMDPHNSKTFASKQALDYWQDVDIYIGGTEHAVGHLLYARFWHKFLHDLNYVPTKEPFKQLVNQGMIQGRSSFIYRDKQSGNYISKGLINNYKNITPIHVDVNLVENDQLDIAAFKKQSPEKEKAEFTLEQGIYKCGWEVEKMSKSKLNVVNPDDVIEKYGADTLRLYEMFLGPIEQHKPWNTDSIEGVHRFLKKLWRTCIDENGNSILKSGEPTQKELKILHTCIKKITSDIDKLSFNTAVSSFMICLNELNAESCKKNSIFQPYFILLAPFAPFIAEELWEKSGQNTSIAIAKWPTHNEDYLKENTFPCPVAINGKVKIVLEIEKSLTKEQIQTLVFETSKIKQALKETPPKKVIVVPGKIVNIVV